MKKLSILGCILGMVLLPIAALADGISPTSVTGTLAVGGSVTISKTVTVSAGTPTAAQGDVFFLCDTTGSMGGTIDDVKTNASAILTGLSAYGNISTGAASYRDVPADVWGESTDYAARVDSPIGSAASTQAGINTWVAGGGYDGPESQLIALYGGSTEPGYTEAGWRTGSEKFVLWFGDSPGHEPSNTPGYPGPSTAQTIDALQAAGITVYAFDVGGWGGLDSDGGQATAITDATGGALYNGFETGIVDTIIGAIGEGFSEYSMVGIEAPYLAGLGISIVPTSYSGSFDRSIERTFTFDVTFTGLAPGTYDFDMFGTVDGGRIATEHDLITVTGTAVPEPATMLLLGLGLLGLAGVRRKM